MYVLLALFLGSWLGQFVTMLIEAGNEARAHGEGFSMADFWPQFWASTFENWQSEWLQLFVQGGLLLGMKHVLFKADAEDTERIEAKLDALLRARGVDPDAVDAERLRAESTSFE